MTMSNIQISPREALPPLDKILGDPFCIWRRLVGGSDDAGGWGCLVPNGLGG